MKKVLVILLFFIFNHFLFAQTMPITYKEDLQIKKYENTKILIWETASEINNKGFFVEGMLAGEVEFRKIGFVEGIGKPSKYQFKLNPNEDFNYYRLTQVDYDGTISVSKIIINDYYKPNFAVYPNPFTNQISLLGPSEIFDEKGNLVFKNTEEELKMVNLNHLPNGIYFLKTKNKTITMVKVQ